MGTSIDWARFGRAVGAEVQQGIAGGPTSIPLAITAVMRRRIGIGDRVPLDPSDGQPRSHWWDRLASEVERACKQVLETFDPENDLYVQVTSAEDDGWREHIAIQVTSRLGLGLGLRIYVLRWTGEGTRLDAVTHDAWCEIWRSLYAPDADL